VTRHLIRTAVGRGWRKRCPHCGVGHLFEGWAHHVDSCATCGLVYEKNAGDTWAFTVLGDRLPIGAMVLLVYFSLFRAHHALGFAAFALIAVGFLWTLPNRWGVGIALHYVSRVYWPDPADPVPGMPGTSGIGDRPRP
jgi:uncharacterized protein (DUF983 family)